MAITKISVRGARQHNLKNIDVEIPRNTLTVITVKVLRGISTSMFLRLCCRAPCTVMLFSKGSSFSHTPFSIAGLRSG